MAPARACLTSRMASSADKPDSMSSSAATSTGSAETAPATQEHPTPLGQPLVELGAPRLPPAGELGAGRLQIGDGKMGPAHAGAPYLPAEIRHPQLMQLVILDKRGHDHHPTHALSAATSTARSQVPRAHRRPSRPSCRDRWSFRSVRPHPTGQNSSTRSGWLLLVRASLTAAPAFHPSMVASAVIASPASSSATTRASTGQNGFGRGRCTQGPPLRPAGQDPTNPLLRHRIDPVHRSKRAPAMAALVSVSPPRRTVSHTPDSRSGA